MSESYSELKRGSRTDVVRNGGIENRPTRYRRSGGTIRSTTFRQIKWEPAKQSRMSQQGFELCSRLSLPILMRCSPILYWPAARFSM